MSKYKAKARLEPGKAVEVLEYDEHGNLVGAYKGYWNFGRHTVALYPDFRHPFARWRGTPTKRVVSDRLVEVAAVAPTSRGEVSSARGAEVGSRKLRKLPLEGQEKINF